jgi:hypothetical protein
MTLNDLLGRILLRMEMMAEGSNAFTADEVAGWPEGALDFFVRQRLLSPATPVHQAVCDGCEEGCFMPVKVASANAPIASTPFIICNQRDDIGRVRVDTNRLKRWRVDSGLLAGAISKLLGIDQTPQELVRRRLWFIGKTGLAGNSNEVFLARGLSWTDAGEIFGHNRDLRESGSPLIFAPGKPSNGFLPNATLVSLDRLLIVQKDRLTLDLEAIIRVIATKSKTEPFTGTSSRRPASSGPSLSMAASSGSKTARVSNTSTICWLIRGKNFTPSGYSLKSREMLWATATLPRLWSGNSWTMVSMSLLSAMPGPYWMTRPGKHISSGSTTSPKN